MTVDRRVSSIESSFKMQRFITDERTGIQYELIGDYYYPCLTIENEEPPTLTKYGRMRERYLREHRKILYINLLTSGKLYEHLADIDTSACDMAEYLIKEMARKQGVTEELFYDRYVFIYAREMSAKTMAAGMGGRRQYTGFIDGESARLQVAQERGSPVP